MSQTEGARVGASFSSVVVFGFFGPRLKSAPKISLLIEKFSQSGLDSSFFFLLFVYFFLCHHKEKSSKTVSDGLPASALLALSSGRMLLCSGTLFCNECEASCEQQRIQ
jgi:hypothetical protein